MELHKGMTILSAPINVTPESQADRRTDMVINDQFGRAWLYAMDNKTMEPVGGVDPAGWADPLRTPQKYLSVPKNRFGRRELDKIVLNVKQWADDQKQALAQWGEHVMDCCQQLTKRLIPMKQLEAEFPDVIVQAGPKPWPSAEVIERLRAGDDTARELLGQHSEQRQAGTGKRYRVTVLSPETRKLLDPDGRRGLWSLDETLYDGMGGFALPSETVAPGTAQPTYEDFVSEFGIKVGAAKWREHKLALAGG